MSYCLLKALEGETGTLFHFSKRQLVDSKTIDLVDSYNWLIVFGWLGYLPANLLTSVFQVFNDSLLFSNQLFEMRNFID